MNDGAGSINARCADRLREAADLLQAQGANPFRVSAYRKAAATVLELPEDLQAHRRSRGAARPRSAAEHRAWHRRRAARDDAHRALDAARAAARQRRPGAVAHRGAGPRSSPRRAHPRRAARRHARGLELAAHDGRLESVPGVGPRRAAAIRASLQTMLSRSRPHRAAPRTGAADEPPVAMLLDVDR
jgi:DNA polymerase (family X)